MANEVKLPQLGQTMEEGTIVGCLVKVGDEVKKGDIIFEVETDKATLEMESPADGFVKHIVVEMNQTIPVGDVMLILGGKDEVVEVDSVKAEATESAQSPAAEAASAPQATVTTQESKPAKAGGRIIASPRAKRLAKELGVDLAGITGSGPNGRIVEADVKSAPTKTAATTLS